MNKIDLRRYLLLLFLKDESIIGLLQFSLTERVKYQPENDGLSAINSVGES